MQKIFLKLCLFLGVIGLVSCSSNTYLEDEYTQGDVFIDEDVELSSESPSDLAKVFNLRVPNFNPLLVCRNKQCAPAEMASTRQYVFNALAHLVDNNSDQKALLCEANPQSHVCINPYLTVPAKIGVVPSYVYFDSVKIVDASLVKGMTAINLALQYNLSYNGQTPSVCKPDKSMLYVKDNKSIILNGEGFKCNMTSMGTTTVRVMFDIDYIDMDYGYIGGYFSIGLSGPAMGGGNGYGMIRLTKDAFPLNPVLMELSKENNNENINASIKENEKLEKSDETQNQDNKKEEINEEKKLEDNQEAEVKKEEKVDDVNAFEVGNDVTEALKQPKSETKKTEDLADNILSEDDGIYEDVYFDGEEEVNIEDLEEYIK